MVRPTAGLNHNKLIAVCLAVLAVVLLAIDIGLGVYCKSEKTMKHSKNYYMEKMRFKIPNIVVKVRTREF